MAAADTRGGTNGCLFYLGRFYDNVLVSLHGQSTAGTAFKKKSHNVDFPRDNRFTWKEGQGKVKDVRLLTNYADKSKLRNQLAYEIYAGSGTGLLLRLPRPRPHQRRLLWHRRPDGGHRRELPRAPGLRPGRRLLQDLRHPLQRHHRGKENPSV